MPHRADPPALVERRFDSATCASHAVWSPCGAFRYALHRRWGAGGTLLYIMLNPSKATEERNDPTIERCERRARRLGFGGFGVVNLFAFCATRPRDLFAADDPVGPANDAVLRDAPRGADAVLCAWGTHGARFGRDRAVIGLLADRPLTVLGLTRAGHPAHPLYLSYDLRPLPWQPGTLR